MNHTALFPGTTKPLHVVDRFYRSWHVQHQHPDGVGLCVLWDVEGDGRFCLECDRQKCPLYFHPIELAADLGIPQAWVHPIDQWLSGFSEADQLAAAGAGIRRYPEDYPDAGTFMDRSAA